MMNKIDLERARQLQTSIGFFATNFSPVNTDALALPENLITAWKNYTDAKAEFNKILEVYSIEKIS